jgi:transposase
MVTRLRMPLSGDTVLRILRATPLTAQSAPRVLGMDDFALRKGRIYGTVLVDLEQHRPVDLLPERTAETVTTWLRAHPEVEVIARDRAQDYARGAAEGAPHATQVADRFHLMCNLHEVLTRYLQRVAPALRRVLTSEPAAAPLVTTETPKTTTAARRAVRISRACGARFETRAFLARVLSSPSGSMPTATALPWGSRRLPPGL